MNKEGTGNPRTPDISFDAEVKAGELRFEQAPETEVRFSGNTRRHSVWESGREALPARVQEGVLYRDAKVRLRIATEIDNEWNAPIGQNDESSNRT